MDDKMLRSTLGISAVFETRNPRPGNFCGILQDIDGQMEDVAPI